MREPTEEDHAGWTDVSAFIDEEFCAVLTARADASGRTLSMQLVYELQVNRGRCQPDPGDREATERGQLFRRMFTQRPLNG